MLTSELMRVSLRKGIIKPSFIDPSKARFVELAEGLVDIYEEHEGATQGDLDEALQSYIGAMPNFRLVRGIAKILSRRTELETDSPIDPVDLRRLVFERAAEHHPIARRPNKRGLTHRDALLEAIAGELDTTPDAIQRGLFADLRSEQRVASFDPISPLDLLHRYNVALAQGVLLRANRLTLDIHLKGRLSSARYRQLFRYIKFHQLLHTISPRKGGGYTITVDGPMSLFKHSGKYGFQMACFLPALLLCEGWSLTADVLWGRKRKPYTFHLTPEAGLESHYRERGVYLSEPEQLFVDRFEALESPWKLLRENVLIRLGGQGLLVPDFRVTHAEDAREAYLEIIGYWHSDYLQRRLKLLADKGPPNLILAISDRFQTDKLDLTNLPTPVFFFKRVIRPRKILELIEDVAQRQD